MIHRYIRRWRCTWQHRRHRQHTGYLGTLAILSLLTATIAMTGVLSDIENVAQTPAHSAINATSQNAPVSQIIPDMAEANPDNPDNPDNSDNSDNSDIGLEHLPILQPFDLDASRRMAVAVTIAGRGPFSFLVDTGAERTVIAHELADRLAMTPGRSLRIATISGLTKVPSHRVTSLEIAALRLGALDAPTLAGRHIGAAGLLGVDMLQNRRVVLDFTRQTMQIVESRRRARPKIARFENAIIVTAYRRAGRLILSDATIGGRRIDLIVDTGAQTSIGNLALKRMITKRRQNTRPFAPATLVGVNGRTIIGEQTVIKKIALEGVHVTNLPITFVDAHAFRVLNMHERPAMLLGMDALQLFERVEIDFVNRRVVFILPDMSARYRFNQRLAMQPDQGQAH